MNGDPDVCPVCKGKGKILYPKTQDLVVCHRCFGGGSVPKNGDTHKVEK